MAVTPTLQPRSQAHSYWGVFATALGLPNAAGAPLAGPEFFKLEEGGVAFVQSAPGQWAYCVSPGTIGGGNAVWNVLTPGGASNFIQSADAFLAADVSTASGLFLPLLSVPIVSAAPGFLSSDFTVSSANNAFFGAQNSFRLLVDGVIQHTGASFVGGATVTQSCGICDRTPVLAGPHVVQVQWRVDAGTGFIRPVSQPNLEHASLVVWETLT